VTKDYVTYTAGEVNLLISIASKRLDTSLPRDRYYSELTSILQTISSKMGTLTEGNFEVATKKVGVIKSEHHPEVIRLLFFEVLDKMPLFLNTPVLEVIAHFRLQIGR